MADNQKKRHTCAQLSTRATATCCLTFCWEVSAKSWRRSFFPGLPVLDSIRIHLFEMADFDLPPTQTQTQSTQGDTSQSSSCLEVNPCWGRLRSMKLRLQTVGKRSFMIFGSLATNKSGFHYCAHFVPVQLCLWGLLALNRWGNNMDLCLFTYI